MCVSFWFNSKTWINKRKIKFSLELEKRMGHGKRGHFLFQSPQQQFINSAPHSADSLLRIQVRELHGWVWSYIHELYNFFIIVKTWEKNSLSVRYQWWGFVFQHHPRMQIKLAYHFCTCILTFCITWSSSVSLAKIQSMKRHLKKEAQKMLIVVMNNI